MKAVVFDFFTFLAFRQRLPPNVKEALLFDVNNDGLVELVVALTDRVVRTYQWRRAQDGGGFLASLNKWEFGGQVSKQI